MSATRYRLYGDRRSGSATVELALAEIGVEVECVEVVLDDRAQRADDYARLNAQRKLPTLVMPDGDLMTESAAILLVLADRYPQAGLLPAGPERAQAMRWLLFIATELYPLIEIIDYPERYIPAGESATPRQKERLRELVRGKWKDRWRLVDAAASGSPWFLDSGFSLVDIYSAVVSRWAQLDHWRATSLPRIEAIASAVARRERCAAVWSRHFD